MELKVKKAMGSPKDTLKMDKGGRSWAMECSVGFTPRKCTKDGSLGRKRLLRTAFFPMQGEEL